jgi:hypothetical protein
MNNDSMFLFARPSFLEGMARVVDIGGTLNVYNTSLTPDQADRLALLSDIAALRKDLVQAVARLQSENAEAETVIS